VQGARCVARFVRLTLLPIWVFPLNDHASN
jgi:hypothetical protein